MPPVLTNVPWSPFIYEDQVHDLTHLHPCEMAYEQAAKGDKPSIVYRVDVTFSLHCFTRSLPKTGEYDRALLYPNSCEERLFDATRYEYSKRLPEIIRTLTRRKCMHTGHGNFFTVELVSANGETVDYDVFFTATKSSRKGRINLFIQSAFVREKAKLPATRPIGFLIILHNTLNKKAIKD